MAGQRGGNVCLLFEFSMLKGAKVVATNVTKVAVLLLVWLVRIEDALGFPAMGTFFVVSSKQFVGPLKRPWPPSLFLLGTQHDASEKAEITGDILYDEFSHLVESNPHDDPEPQPHRHPPSSASRRRKVSSSPRQNVFDIPTDPNQEWEWLFEKLHAQFGKKDLGDSESMISHSNVIEQALIRHWMANQRKSFMKTLGVLDLSDKANWGTSYLLRDRKERLDSLGFDWGHLQPPTLTNDIIYSDDFQRKVRIKYKDRIWNTYYDRLCRYWQQHGNTNIPLDSDDDDDVVSLREFAAEQRRIRWEMPERRRALLDKINFDWDWSDRSSAFVETPTEKIVSREESIEQDTKSVSFARRLTQLKEYRKQHGDCNVPHDFEDDPGLGEWVRKMKRCHHKLTPRTLTQLKKVGMVFSEQQDET